MNTMKKNGGFTLVELIIVIAILAILSTGAIAGYSAYIKSANNAAVQAVLSDISTSAVLANAQAGGIETIEVKKSTTAGKLDVIVTVTTNVADDFQTNFMASLKAINASANVPETGTDNVKTYVCTVDIPGAWGSSWYGEQSSVTWQNSVWPKAN